MAKHVVFLRAAIAALTLSCSVSLADGASSAPTTMPQGAAMAQLGPQPNKLNPTNDPDVQRGIDQRQEQEYQRRIQACVDQRTANMDPTARANVLNDVRLECTHGVQSTGIRG